MYVSPCFMRCDTALTLSLGSPPFRRAGADEATAEAAVGALANLSASPEAQISANAAGAIGLVCAAMKVHPASAKLQEAACKALTNLTCAGKFAVTGAEGAQRVPLASPPVRRGFPVCTRFPVPARDREPMSDVVLLRAIREPATAAAKDAGAEDLARAALARFAYDAGVRRSAEHALRNLDAATGGSAEPKPLTLPDVLEDIELNRQCAPGPQECALAVPVSCRAVPRCTVSCV